MSRNFICAGCGLEIFDITLRKSSETRCLICRELAPAPPAPPPQVPAPRPEAAR